MNHKLFGLLAQAYYELVLTTYINSFVLFYILPQSSWLVTSHLASPVPMASP